MRKAVTALLAAAALTGCGTAPQHDDTQAVVDTIVNVAEAGQQYGATLDLDLSSYREGIYTFHKPNAVSWEAMRVAQGVAKADPYMKFVLVGDYSVVTQRSWGGERIVSLCIIGPTIESALGECEEVH